MGTNDVSESYSQVLRMDELFVFSTYELTIINFKGTLCLLGTMIFSIT